MFCRTVIGVIELQGKRIIMTLLVHCAVVVPISDDSYQLY
jgi:hypothetical protein